MSQKTITILLTIIIILGGTFLLISLKKEEGVSINSIETERGSMYQNETYGFKLVFPESWKNYSSKIIHQTEENRVDIRFGIPRAEEIFTLSIYKKEDWKTAQEEDFFAGELLEETEEFAYVFQQGNLYSPDNAPENEIFLTDALQDIEKIKASFKLFDPSK